MKNSFKWRKPKYNIQKKASNLKKKKTKKITNPAQEETNLIDAKKKM